MVMYLCSRCLFSIFTTPTNLRQTSKLLLSDNKNNFTIDTTSRDKILCLCCFFKAKSFCNKGFQFTFTNQSQSSELLLIFVALSFVKFKLGLTMFYFTVFTTHVIIMSFSYFYCGVHYIRHMCNIRFGVFFTAK